MVMLAELTAQHKKMRLSGSKTRVRAAHGVARQPRPSDRRSRRDHGRGQRLRSHKADSSARSPQGGREVSDKTNLGTSASPLAEADVVTSTTHVDSLE